MTQILYIHIRSQIFLHCFILWHAKKPSSEISPFNVFTYDAFITSFAQGQIFFFLIPGIIIGRKKKKSSCVFWKKFLFRFVSELIIEIMIWTTDGNSVGRRGFYKPFYSLQSLLNEWNNNAIYLSPNPLERAVLKARHCWQFLWEIRV